MNRRESTAGWKKSKLKLGGEIVEAVASYNGGNIDPVGVGKNCNNGNIRHTVKLNPKDGYFGSGGLGLVPDGAAGRYRFRQPSQHVANER